MFLGSILLFGTFFPQFVRAQSSDMTGGGPSTGITYDCGVNTASGGQVGQQQNKDPNGNPVYGNCTYADLIAAVKKVINWGTLFALSFTVVVLAWAGFQYMMSQGNPGKLQKVHKMFWTVAEGIFWILTAWLIVHFILVALASTAVQNASPIQ